MRGDGRSPREFLVSSHLLFWGVGLHLLGVAGIFVTLVVLHPTVHARAGWVIEVLAGALMVLAAGEVAFVLRVARSQRRLERTLTKLQRGSVAPGRNPLGALGSAFQEHFRLLWRRNLVQEGIIATNRTVIELLAESMREALYIFDGQGQLRYATGGVRAVACDPPIEHVVASLVGHERVDTVRIAGRAMGCHPVYGPILLQRDGDGRDLLVPREALAYIVVSAAPLEIPHRPGCNGCFRRAKRSPLPVDGGRAPLSALPPRFYSAVIGISPSRIASICVCSCRRSRAIPSVSAAG